MNYFRTTYLGTAAGIAALVAAGFAVSHFANADDLAQSIARCKAEGPKTQQCLNDLVVETGREKGLEAGLDALQAVYMADSEFAGTCHGTTHELGIQAYDVFERGGALNLNDKTSYCGFGFFHGFMEVLLQTGKDLSEARTFCEDTVNKLHSSIAGVTAGCYHGIGHGVVDGSDPSKWGDDSRYIQDGLKLCRDLTTDEENRERCASGVFNALAIVYDTPKYGLNPDKNNPYRICKKQTEDFAKDSCYDQMNGFVVRLYPTFTDALKVAQDTTELAYRETAIGAVAGYRAQPALVEKRDLADFVRDCNTLDEKWRNKCADSFAVGMIEFGKPKQEYVLAVDTCVRTGELMHACLHGVEDAVHVRLDPSLHPAACSYVENKAGKFEGDACREFMKS